MRIFRAVNTSAEFPTTAGGETSSNCRGARTGAKALKALRQIA